MSDPYSDEIVEDAQIDGLGERSGFGSFLRGLLLGVFVSGAVLLGLTLSRPLPSNLPGIGSVQVEGGTQTIVKQTGALTETATEADTATTELRATDPAPESGDENATPESASVAPTADTTETESNETALTSDSPTPTPSEPEAEAPTLEADTQTETTSTIQSTSTAAEDTTELAAVTPSAPVVEAPSLPEPPALSLSGPALTVNARDYEAPINAPLMAVVLENAGNGVIEPDALALLTMPLTLSITPKGPESTALAESARAAKHEILVQLPIATSAEQIGVGVLHAGLSGDAIQALTQRSLATLPTALGTTPPNGASLTTDADAMQSILQPLQQHGFAFIDQPVGGGSVVASLAKEAGLTYTASSRYVVPGATADQIFTSLENAAFQARQRGTAIVRIEASREALSALLRWGLEKDRRPVWFAPVSAVVKRRASTQ